MGFEQTASAPSFYALSIYEVENAELTIIFKSQSMSFYYLRLLISRVASIPSISGICISRKIIL